MFNFIVNYQNLPFRDNDKNSSMFRNDVKAKGAFMNIEFTFFILHNWF